MKILPREYVLGHSDRELYRIIFQAKILNPITHKMLEQCGICEGMNVLDLGCGTGEVTRLVANLVGKTGRVIAIEQSLDALEVAKQNFSHNITFVHGRFADIDFDQKFDMVVGRAVILFQKDVNSFLKKAAGLVKSGGTLAFHEIDDIRHLITNTDTQLWNKTVKEILYRLKNNCPQYDIAHRFVKEFSKAGLDVPTLAYEIPTEGGKAEALCFWAVETLVSLSNESEYLIFNDGTTIHSKELLTLLQEEIEKSNSSIQFLGQACAWVKVA